MPRSFLVKKYFTNKKPNYSELESQNGPLCALVPERSPLAELPTTADGSLVSTYSPVLLWSSTTSPLSFTAVSPSTPPSTPSPARPLDLSSPSSSGEEDEGRTSDPPSPDPTERFQCGRCGKTCGSRAALSRHQLSHCTSAGAGHGATHGEPTGTGSRAAFRCKHCPKEYNSLGALKMHIRSHTLPCVCTTCGKAFSRPWLLRGHIRTHTGERPFSCPHCNRAFADRSNLRAHLQTHAEVKKYQCSTCSRTFSRMSLLHKHSVSNCCSSA